MVTDREGTHMNRQLLFAPVLVDIEEQKRITLQHSTRGDTLVDTYWHNAHLVRMDADPSVAGAGHLWLGGIRQDSFWEVRSTTLDIPREVPVSDII
eukprot:611487-Pyramimonas_sp.AAC.1